MGEGRGLERCLKEGGSPLLLPFFSFVFFVSFFSFFFLKIFERLFLLVKERERVSSLRVFCDTRLKIIMSYYFA